ncbi:MAG TPA: plastocyanin/azurin family copper-binding protein [Solirubrobacteraceae bacterium]|jgi:plastocyanin|nr:plastocyanin/azurin family copper-binding protein [Solirubrobacteraceae bacterium]
MIPARTIAASCVALLLASGCGSSSHPSASATPTSALTPGLRVSTTPRYAAPPASAPAQSGVIQIAYRNITIRPDTLKAKVGSTIAWTNEDPIEHNVTSQSGPAKFASKNFGQGQSFRVTLTRPGVLHYLCTIHPTTMNGTIDVVP